MLRYEFQTIEQIRNHLHQAEGRTLLFFPDPQAKETNGQRVLLELACRSADQAALLRGTVLCRQTGSTGGLWLEFGDTRLARKLAGGTPTLGARKQRRLAVDLLVELQIEGGQKLVVRALDVSLGGLRVAGGQGLSPGQTVSVRLLTPLAGAPRALVRAEVSRYGSGGDAALRLLRDEPAGRAAATSLFDAVRAAWAKAREMVHPPMCCRTGKPLDPPLPRVRARD